VFANLPSKARHAEKLANAFDPTRNAFGLFRFALAALVIVSHCYPLGGFGRDPLEVVTAGRLSLGLFAVAMFFVLSGFLITRSASRTSAVRFLWHRFLRIFPGYWVCLVVCAFILAPMICQVRIHPCLSNFRSPTRFTTTVLGRQLRHASSESLEHLRRDERFATIHWQDIAPESLSVRIQWLDLDTAV
jgi:hypothetical protein